MRRKRNCLPIASLLLFSLVFSQSITAQLAPAPRVIRGLITNEKDEPLQGVNIVVKNTDAGTTSDAKGSFQLTLRTSDPTLLFSSTGYGSRELKPGAETFLKIVLKTAVLNLDDVVVVGYGKQKKITVTGAISQIEGKELVKSPVGNITNSLIGKVTGFTSISQNGQPGKQLADIFVRGKATFSGDPSAIVIVDGVERADFGTIDANEIESISILKDAASTAIFGIRGANGVVIVTTKSGSESRPKLSYSGNVSFNVFTNQPRLLDAYNSAVLKNEGAVYDGQPKPFTDDELQKFKDGSDPLGYPNTDWIKYVSRTHTMQTQHNINVSGGTRYVKYFASVGYYYEDGIFKNFSSPYNIRSANDYNRYNFRSNLDFNLSKDLQLGVKLGARTESTYEPNNSSLGTIGRIFYQIELTPTFAYPATLPDGRLVNINNIGPNSYNPIGLLSRSGYRQIQKNSFQTTINLDYKLNWITQGLKFSSLFTFDNEMNTVTTQNSSFASYNLDRITKAVTLDAVFRTDNPLGPISVTPNTSQGGTNYNLFLGFDYNRKFNRHALSGLLRFTRRVTPPYSVAAGIPAIPSLSQGVVGRVTYNYSEKYLAEVNLGYNGSENFPKGQRYGIFPAFSAGWVVSNEPFFKDNLLSVINFFKIRGSYGYVGNDRIGGNRFLYLNGYAQQNGASTYPWSSPNTRLQFGDPLAPTNYTVVNHSQIGYPNVTWEKSLKRNIGFESRFLGGAIELNVDFFDENRYDILLNRQSGSVTYGEAYPAINFGKVYNKGYEAELKLKRQFGNLVLGIASQVSFARNKVIERDEPRSIPANLRSAGQSIDRQLGFVTAGFYNSAADIAAWPTNKLSTPVRPGDLKFVDINKDGVIDNNDRTTILNPTLPEYIYSVRPSIEWKSFSLSVLFQGTANSSSSSVMVFNWFEFMMGRWTPDKVAKGEKITWPAVPFSYASTSINNPNDFILSDNSYLKVRNAELAWQVPARYTRRLKLSALKFYFTGENLFIWTKYKYYMDPEVTIGAGDYRKEYAYPSSRRFNFGINVQF